MARRQPRYECAECGAALAQWAGRCPECNRWNTLREASPQPVSSPAAEIHSLAALPPNDRERITTGITELDRVLGGGLMRNSTVLLGGDPGIGKSTLLLQALARMAELGARALYVSGEESADQLAQRARRLNLAGADLRLLIDNDLERVQAAIAAECPQVAVIDSIQTLSSNQGSAAPGTVTQLRECAGACVRLARDRDVAVFLIGHVTKEGILAGPRLLEHVVDTVLYFEGEGGSRHRVLRAAKNRYGAVNEIGVFAMTDRGLREMDNPSAIFLSRPAGNPPGSVVTVTREGTRPLLVEVQALLDDSRPSAPPQRLVTGLAQGRLDMLLAVLHRHGGANVHGQDVFVNVVGGIRVTETAADLPVLLALVSSLHDRPWPEELVAFGEVGLAGEVRPVPGGPERLQAAAKHGFRRAVIPAANHPPRSHGLRQDLEIIAVERLSEALARISHEVTR